MRVKNIVLMCLMFFIWQVQSQHIKKIIKNKKFIANIGSMCVETDVPDPCAGEEIYLILKFKRKKVKITEIYISLCDEKTIIYKLKYKWQVINGNEIKIDYTPDEVSYKSIEKMKFKVADGILIGEETTWNNIELYTFKAL